MIRACDEPEDATQWLERAAILLGRGVRDGESAWHTFALATVCPSGPDLRTVALRGIERETMSVEFWTDRRSAKVADLSRGGAALFWDRKSHIQLRLRGSVEIAGTKDAAVATLFDSLPDLSLRNYATLAAPGAVPADEHDDPDERGDRDLARANFLRCRIRPETGDLVHLGRERHRRFAYTFASGAIDATEVVP